MRTEKVLPETLLQLMLNVLETAPDFIYKKGIQPFLMEIGGKDYYVYVKNLSSAYFKTRPDTTRAQLPVKEDFDEIKHSIIPFVFLGYDRINDVLVCWNHHIAKQRLNERKSVSFYSRSFFQEEVVSGEFLKKNLKNGDTPVLFKRKDIVSFFRNIDSFFGKPTNDSTSRYGIPSNGKILKITDNGLLKKLRPLLDTETPHTLEAIKITQQYYGNLSVSRSNSSMTSRPCTETRFPFSTTLTSPFSAKADSLFKQGNTNCSAANTCPFLIKE